MKKIIIFIFLFIVSFMGGFYANEFYRNLGSSEKAKISPKIKPRPLDKYTIENLSKVQISPSKITIEKSLKEEKDFTSYLFSYSFDPTLQNKNFKKVTGLLNIPKKEGLFPIVIMLRGYVDQKTYQTGIGTQRGGEYFANNGFITIAPDFLGYGESDPEASDIFESRFQTYTTALTLLASLNSIESWDKQNVFIWAHSNGGQIALTLLEITGTDYPTILWAPVSKPFPYSVLYYTDESDDHGKFIRRELAKFEEDYDTDLYSIHKYYDKITAPIEIHQGTYDDAVPVAWSDTLVKTLKNQGNEVNYFKYPGADHNLTPGWDTAIARSLSFFKGQIK